MLMAQEEARSSAFSTSNVDVTVADSLLLVWFLPDKNKMSSCLQWWTDTGSVADADI